MTLIDGYISAIIQKSLTSAMAYILPSIIIFYKTVAKLHRHPNPRQCQVQICCRKHDFKEIPSQEYHVIITMHFNSIDTPTRKIGAHGVRAVFPISL